MRENRSKQEKYNKKNNKCKIKCRTCHFYILEDDYCTERDIESCTRRTNVNFSKCPNFLIRENLVMF